MEIKTALAVPFVPQLGAEWSWPRGPATGQTRGAQMGKTASQTPLTPRAGAIGGANSSQRQPLYREPLALAPPPRPGPSVGPSSMGRVQVRPQLGNSRCNFYFLAYMAYDTIRLCDPVTVHRIGRRRSCDANCLRLRDVTLRRPSWPKCRGKRRITHCPRIKISSYTHLRRKYKHTYKPHSLTLGSHTNSSLLPWKHRICHNAHTTANTASQNKTYSD